MAAQLAQVPLERIVKGIEYREMSGLLADFHRFIERDAETPTVLGRSAAQFVKRELDDTRVNLTTIH